MPIITPSNAKLLTELSEKSTAALTDIIFLYETVNSLPYKLPLSKLGIIIESGSNSNGRWIKFSDGTMIQYARVTMSFNNSTMATTDFYYVTPFVAAGDAATREQTRKAFMIASGRVADYAGMMMAEVGADDNYVTLTYRITAARTADRPVDVFIIGRWK